MALIPWRSQDSFWGPFQELENIQNEINKLFSTSLVRSAHKGLPQLFETWAPAIDMYDSKDNILVRADIPGLEKDEIDVSVHGDTLVLKGEKKHEHETKEKDYIRKERFFGSFYRAIPLSSEVDASTIKASYKKGVLEISLPKKEQAQPKQLKIDVE